VTTPPRTFGYAVKWAFVVNTGRRSINMLFTVLLAALLGPRPFGVVAMALVYLGLIELVLEQGLSTAIIQREDLEPGHLDSAFWMNFVWCLLLAGVSVAASGWWADVNDTPELAGVIRALSLMLVLTGLLIVQQAVLIRELDFKTLAIRSNIASLLGGGLGLALALAGAGVWSLVAQQLTMEGTAAVLLWRLGSWRPRLRFSPAHARQLLAFSADVFVGNVGNFVARRADALLMGIFFGPVAVGLYRLADRFVDVLLDFTTRPVASVSLPVLARLTHDPPALRRALASCFRTTLLLTIPGMLLLAATSGELLSVLGPEWAAASDPLRLLALVGIGQAVALFSGPVLYALARPRLRALLVWTLAPLSTANVVVVGILLESATTGDQVLGLAASRVLLFAAIFVPLNIALVLRLTGLSLRSLLSLAWTPFLAGAAGYGAVVAVRASGVLDSFPALLALVVAGAVGAVAVAALLLLLEPRVREPALRLRRLAWSRAFGTTAK
jgi:teichuronic acid exporter